MSAVRCIISGGAAADQLQHEMAALTDMERRELLTAATPLHISAEEILALKGNKVGKPHKMAHPSP